MDMLRCGITLTVRLGRPQFLSPQSIAGASDKPRYNAFLDVFFAESGFRGPMLLQVKAHLVVHGL
jgi:hypothetical protein